MANARALLLVGAFLLGGCASVAVQMQPGQTAEIAQRAHAFCFDETHSYLAQVAAGPLLHTAKAWQAHDYIACMAQRGFVVRYAEGMGYHPDLRLITER